MAHERRITALCSGVINNRPYFSGDDITWLTQGDDGIPEENIVANGLGRVEYAPSNTGNYREAVFALVSGFSDGRMFQTGDDISFLTQAAEGREAVPARRLVETGLGRIGYVEIPVVGGKKKEPKADVETDI